MFFLITYCCGCLIVITVVVVAVVAAAAEPVPWTRDLKIWHDCPNWRHNLHTACWCHWEKTRMVDTFKAYAKEVGVKAIISDSAMMIVTCLIANYLANESPSVNTVTFIVSVYCVPYLIYTW
jgi:hypothetical protein